MGTIVNVIAIIIGGSVGILGRKILKPQLQQAVMKAMALCILVIGIQGAIPTQNMILVISSLVIGTLIGEALKLDDRFNGLSGKIEAKYFKKPGSFAQGFVNCSCLYLIGAMAIIGSIQSGLGNDQVLYAKALLDGIGSVFFAALYGIGVLFSALPVLIYQGIITLAAKSLYDLLSPELIRELTAVGSMMIVAIALNMLELTKIKIANLLPGLVVLPLLLLVVLPLFGL